MSIIVKNLVKKYSQQYAVDDISFNVNKGEIVGFLGPNGAGKSTTMKSIAGSIIADAGEIAVCGYRVGPSSLASRKQIGYLPENNALYNEMYVREYLEFLANVYQVHHKKKAIQNSIELTGLTTEANKKIRQLSKGYKQRVGLAAALIHNPPVLILDEPTTGLDPNQIIEIRALIKELGANKTVLFSSHILQEVQAICSRIIIIHKGKIVADDTLNNLIQETRHNQLILRIKEVVTADVFEGIEFVEQHDATTWIFKTNQVEQLKRKIMEVALEKNINIISWDSESAQTLENIFKTLTLR